MFYYVFNNCSFLHIHVLKCIHNIYSLREICTSKNNPNYHKTCCKFASRSYSVHQALRLKWCLSGNPDTLKVTVPQGGTGTLQVIVVKQKESFFFYTCTSDWFCGKNSQPFMVNMTVYREVFRVFPFKNFITGSSKMVTKSTNMIFSSSACKKTLLLSLWLAVFDSFLLKDSFNCHKT